MADIVFRANLEAKTFPLLTELHGRTVIVKGQDQNYVPQATVKAEADKNIGIPQLYYAHNVLPTTYGYQSVGYQQYVSPEATASFFDSARTIRDGDGNVALMATTTDGRIFILNPLGTTWIEKTPPVGWTDENVTTAYVSGTTYIYFATIGCYKYDWGTSDFVAVTLTGLTAADIIGVVEQAGYLIAFSADAIAYSSTIDPTDFTPSLVTGAGGGSVEGARGAIVAAVPVYQGFIIFTSSNAISATYSQNPRYPFTFTEITGAGGLSDSHYVTYDTNSGSVYAYTTAGLQTVSLRQASTLFPEVTDFLSGSRFEDFDDDTNTFSVNTIGASSLKRLQVIASRYLVISYGYPALSHALVVDTSLQQMGKLKRAHADIFEFQLYDQATIETPRKSMAVLSANGTVHLVNGDIGFPGSEGTILLGKYQYVRSRMLQLQQVDVENASGTLECYDIPTLDGKNFETPIAGYEKVNSGQLRSYAFHNTGMNHSILLRGSFNLVSTVLTFNVHGAR